MRILIAPDKFKGGLTAPEVAAAIAEGVRRADASVQVDECPVADGGEGTVAALVAADGGTLVTRRVTGPLPEMKVDATYGLIDGGRTAVIEMAAASGLALLKPQDRDPMNTTTFGTGELIRAAVEGGARRILLGIGGSATTDAGIGAAQACGFTVLTRDGEPVRMTEPLCGRDLENVLMVKHGRGEVTNGIEITVACDVTNPLYGPSGAAAVFGPQKGATPETVAWLDGQLRALAVRTGHEAEANVPGAGAAGGLGFGMLAFFGAALRPGIEIVIAATKLRERATRADLCITGEGRIDGQSAGGKAVIGVARACAEAGTPCVALVGSVGDGAGAALTHGLTAYFSICDRPMTLDEAMREARGLLASGAEQVARLMLAGSARRKAR